MDTVPKSPFQYRPENVFCGNCLEVCAPSSVSIETEKQHLHNLEGGRERVVGGVLLHVSGNSLETEPLPMTNFCSTQDKHELGEGGQRPTPGSWHYHGRLALHGVLPACSGRVSRQV